MVVDLVDASIVTQKILFILFQLMKIKCTCNSVAPLVFSCNASIIAPLTLSHF